MSSANVVAMVPATDETPAERSPERQALSTAIKVAWRSITAVTAARDALDRGRALLADAEAERESAVAAVATAREADGAAMAKSVRNRDVVAPSATRKARQRAEVADDDVEVARAAIATLEADLAAAEEKEITARRRVEAAVNAVLAAEAAVPLLARLEQIKAEIPALQAALHFIRSRMSERRGTAAYEIAELAAPLAAISPRLSEAIEVGLLFHPLAAEQHPAAERWRAACAALATDADAPLPA